MSEATTPLERSQALHGEAMPRWVRGGLLLVVGGLLVVFALAWRIDPYNGRGAEQRMGTHQQLGLPPCTFLLATGLPCPSCGLTTSFSYTVRGDLVNGARANWVGVLLCLGCGLAVPWAVASAVAGRTLMVKSLERLVVYSVTALMVLLFVRWGLVLIWEVYSRMPWIGP